MGVSSDFDDLIQKAVGGIGTCSFSVLCREKHSRGHLPWNWVALQHRNHGGSWGPSLMKICDGHCVTETHPPFTFVLAIAVAETESYVGLTWNKAYSVPKQWVDTMNYKYYILKKESRRFLKLPPDYGVGLISQQSLPILQNKCLLISRWARSVSPVT